MGCRCFTYLPAGKVFNPSNTWKSLFKAVQEIKNDKERCSILIINDSANPVAKETKIQGYIHSPSRRLFASCFNCQFPSFAQPQQVVFRVETIEVKVNSFCKGCLEPCKITSNQGISPLGLAGHGWGGHQQRWRMEHRGTARNRVKQGMHTLVLHGRAEAKDETQPT